LTSAPGRDQDQDARADGPVPLRAPAPAVACWRASLVEPAPGRAASSERVLSSAEIERAARFGTVALRTRYVLGRAALRQVLGAVLECPPERVPLRRGHRGRPYIDGSPIDFNVSHTRDVAVIAVTRGARVGIDIEHQDRTANAARLAGKLMTGRERLALGPSGTDDHRRRFLRAWTCKEAMSKATGDGIAAPFRTIDVDIDRMVLVAGPPPYQPGDWNLHDVHGLPGFIVTVALWLAAQTPHPDDQAGARMPDQGR